MSSLRFSVGIDRMGEEHWRRFEQALVPIDVSAPPPTAPAPAPSAPPQTAPPSAPVNIPQGRSGFRRF